MKEAKCMVGRAYKIMGTYISIMIVGHQMYEIDPDKEPLKPFLF